MSGMSWHLPECTYHSVNRNGSPWCICDRLRAAEERTKRKWAIPPCKGGALTICVCYGAALSDAREAVAKAPMGTGGYATKQADLAAIDALAP